MTEKQNLAFVGPAGVGKTHNLIEAVDAFVRGREWAPHEAIVGLTFMHGSRRRLHAKVRALRLPHIPVQCLTVDSFCLSLVRRFRRQLGMAEHLLVDPNANAGWHAVERGHRGSFAAIRQSAAELLKCEVVRTVLAASHPLLIVDEFQDCRGDLLDIVSELSSICTTFFAADDFQALEVAAPAVSALTWLVANASVTQLTEVRRTDAPAILNSAHALREGVSKRRCVEVVPVTGAGLGAWEVAARCAWKGWRHARTVIISPCSPMSSNFTAGVLKSLRNQLGKKKKIGPYSFEWEASHEQRIDELCSTLPATTTFKVADLRTAHADPLVREACHRVGHTLRLQGQSSTGREAVVELVKQQLQLHFAHRSSAERLGRIAMTVHGAKNREFENVVVLWPFELANDELYRRKLLYNAITRATRRAVVIVAGGEKRSKKDPVLQLLGGR